MTWYKVGIFFVNTSQKSPVLLNRTFLLFRHNDEIPSTLLAKENYILFIKRAKKRTALNEGLQLPNISSSVRFPSPPLLHKLLEHKVIGTILGESLEYPPTLTPKGGKRCGWSYSQARAVHRFGHIPGQSIDLDTSLRLFLL